MRFVLKNILFFYFFVFLFSAFPCLAAKTAMINGIWITNKTPELVQAEIDGKYETVCLPKLEFADKIDPKEIQRKIHEGIKRQGAVFHLYKDTLGSPIKKSGMFFASDVYLKDLKMTYSQAMAEWGFKFQISTKLPYEDSEYIRYVQAASYIAASSSKDEKPAKKESENAEKKPSIVGIDTAYRNSEVLPAGCLPAPLRNTKDELEKKVREIKNRPFKGEVLKVDFVRWASGKFGNIDETGLIRKNLVEGISIDCLIAVPQEKNWLKPEMNKALASQPCEFILQRDIQGREAKREKAYILADLYFSELGQTWSEFLEANNLKPGPALKGENFATGPITLETLGIDGEWKGFKSQTHALVKLASSSIGPGGDELIRLPPMAETIPNFKAISEKIDSQNLGKPVRVSLIVSPDKKPYTEFGQKRVSRISFPEKKTTLLFLIEEAREALTKKR